MKFALLWSNNATYTRHMSSHTFRLRDLLLPCGSQIHLDQVHVIFRPTSDIQTNEFIPGDSATLTWRAETYHLMVRTTPGNRFVLYTEEALPIVNNQNNGIMDSEFVGTAQRSLTYSSALALTPDVEGDEDYWNRTYRPIRDLPIIPHMCSENALQEFTVELVWPLLQADRRGVQTFVPDYRILKVYVELSVRQS